MPGALIGKLADAEHLGLERRADGVQQIGERPVAGPLPGRAARRAHPSKIGKVRLNCRRQFRVRCHYHSCGPQGYRGLLADLLRDATLLQISTPTNSPADHAINDTISEN